MVYELLNTSTAISVKVVISRPKGSRVNCKPVLLSRLLEVGRATCGYSGNYL